MSGERKKIAFLHRYGLGGWLCCGGHAVPRLAELLSESHELHFFGPESLEPVSEETEKRFIFHRLPWQFDRANPRDKWSKTLRFYLALPGIGWHCRRKKIDFIYWEETLPLGALILQIFYGRNVAIMVMDFFVRIYTEKRHWLHGLRDLVECIDCWSWRRLPLVFTHVEVAKTFLIEHGISPEKVIVIPNPCNHQIFHPVDAQTRESTRQTFGFTEQDVVMTHHGILHPNKGNDWILQRMAALKDELPDLKFLLIGNGSEIGNLKQLAKILGLEGRVVFTGWLPSEEALNQALASMDIGLVMRVGQETDHFHMTDTLNHEMACGKPILAVNLRGIAEFVQDDRNGYLFPVDQGEIFCQRLRQLATTAPQRQKLGNAALITSRAVSSIARCAARMATAIAQQLQ